MQRLTATPFGRRAVTPAQLAAVEMADAPAACGSVDKWQVLRDLTTARETFGLGARTLSVLAALLSFHPKRELSGEAPLIVFPSNRTLSERCHGMAEATLRRHLALLVTAGLVVRHDSPNGKRYASRDRSGTIATAFGFDLRPLLVRAPEISTSALEAREHQAELRRLREAVILKLRDVTALAGNHHASEIHVVIEDTKRALRRKPVVTDLRARFVALEEFEDALRRDVPTQDSSGCDVENERHIQGSESEVPDKNNHQGTVLKHVLKICPRIVEYAASPILDWHGLTRTARNVAMWIGIARETWDEAENVLGPRDVSIILVGLLQAGERIRNPGGYLRTLVRKARTGPFQVMNVLERMLGKSARGKLTAVNFVCS